MVLSYLAAVSQNGYKPGLVVNDKGDTIRGFVWYQNWRKNPEFFKFKNHLEDKEATRCDKSAFQYIEIYGEDAYVKAYIQKDVRPVRMEEIALNTRDLVEKGTFFLRIMVRGKKINLR